MSDDRHVVQNEPVDKAVDASQGVDHSRRKFAKAGLIAAPVIMSLTSRPVLGDQCSLSGMLSTTYSGPDSPLPCAGRTPGFWQTHPEQWGPVSGAQPGKILCVSNYISSQNPKVMWDLSGTSFASIFGVDPFNGASLMQVMWLTGSEDPYQLGAHSVAAWFNSQVTSFNYGLTKEDVIAKFNAAINGTYTNQLGIADPRQALAQEFATLNERGSLGFDKDYTFITDQSLWVSQQAFTDWNFGNGVECPTGFSSNPNQANNKNKNK